MRAAEERKPAVEDFTQVRPRLHVQDEDTTICRATSTAARRNPCAFEVAVLRRTYRKLAHPRVNQRIVLIDYFAAPRLVSHEFELARTASETGFKPGRSSYRIVRIAVSRCKSTNRRSDFARSQRGC